MPETNIKQICASHARLVLACTAWEVTKLKRGQDFKEDFVRQISLGKHNIRLQELVPLPKIVLRLRLRPLPLGDKDLLSNPGIVMCLGHLKVRPLPSSKSEWCASSLLPILSDLCQSLCAYLFPTKVSFLKSKLILFTCWVSDQKRTQRGLLPSASEAVASSKRSSLVRISQRVSSTRSAVGRTQGEVSRCLEVAWRPSWSSGVNSAWWGGARRASRWLAGGRQSMVPPWWFIGWMSKARGYS